jgi:hypothetical protein
MQGVLVTAMILKGLVYPPWNHALALGMEGCKVYLHAAHDIFVCPMLSSKEDWGNDIVEVQCVWVQCQDIFCTPHLSLLISAIPMPIFLEHAPYVPAKLCLCAVALCNAVCGSAKLH